MDDRPTNFLNEAIAAFDRAARAAGELSTNTFCLAGRRVRMKALGAPLTRLLQAFRHLEVDDAGAADLTLHLWDSESSGTPPLVAPWTQSEYGRYGLVDGFNDARFHTALQFEPLSLAMFDVERRLGVYWLPRANLPTPERGAPMRPLLSEWLRRQGCLPMHGGAVGVDGRGVLLAGAGGSGKSNTALSCLAAGLSYASDDFCVVSRGEDWRVHSLYATGKLSAPDFDRLPLYLDLVSNPDEVGVEKALLFLHNRFADRLVRDLELKAVLLPRVRARGRTELAPVSLAEAQRSVAVSTMTMSPGTAAETFRRVAQLVRELPVWELRIGDDWQRAPEIIAALVADAPDRGLTPAAASPPAAVRD